jgi:hypothetical protein
MMLRSLWCTTHQSVLCVCIRVSCIMCLQEIIVNEFERLGVSTPALSWAKRVLDSSHTARVQLILYIFQTLDRPCLGLISE